MTECSITDHGFSGIQITLALIAETSFHNVIIYHVCNSSVFRANTGLFP